MTQKNPATFSVIDGRTPVAKVEIPPIKIPDVTVKAEIDYEKLREIGEALFNSSSLYHDSALGTLAGIHNCVDDIEKRLQKLSVQEVKFPDFPDFPEFPQPHVNVSIPESCVAFKNRIEVPKRVEITLYIYLFLQFLICAGLGYLFIK